MTRKPGRARRPYRAPGRQAAALATRRAILAAGRRLLIKRGYNAMTMERVASEAGVALDTVYAAVGPKPTLIKLLVEAAVSGTDRAVPAEERDYVRSIHAARSAAEKLAIYAGALRAIHPRLAPLVRALRDAAPVHAELARLWRAISDRRRRNMSIFAGELAATGEVRSGLAEEEIADVLWTLSAPEVYVLLVDERGWSPERFELWLADAWRRLLLATSGRAGR